MIQLDELTQRVLLGGEITRHEAYDLLDADLASLEAAGQKITEKLASKAFNLCAIVNAKSGRCGEDCRWCAQSRHYNTGCATYSIIDTKDWEQALKKTAASGIGRLSLVMSGRKLSPREVRETAALIRHAREHYGIEICASLGLLTEDELRTLYEAGLVRYHCNLEASRSYFPKVCTTHTTDDKISTLKAARRVGLDLCSGGIIGMGESAKDRVDLAFELRELNLPSIPINVLVPIAGTPLGNTPKLTDDEIIRTIAIFRFVNPTACLRFAGGRAQMSETLAKRAMRAGINGAIAGDLLTTSGTGATQERELAIEMGYEDESDAAFDRTHLWHPYDRTILPEPRYQVKSAEGVRLTLENGQELIDGTSSWWCAAHGYRVPALVEAIQKQANELAHVMFGGLTHKPAIELGRRLRRWLPNPLSQYFYVDSGSVAVEAALKMAIQYQYAQGQTQRTEIATLRRGYHGDTWNAMSLADPEEGMHSLFGPSLPVRKFLPSPTSVFGGTWYPTDIEPLKHLLETDDTIAAFILEPVMQAAGAMRFYHPRYLLEAARLCREHGVLLILDEIATGFWRTGQRFACDWAGVVPDIITIGKALSGGMVSLAAVATTNHVADTISRGSPGAFMHGPTYMANPIACAAACASLDYFETYDPAKQVAMLEACMKTGLEPLRNRAGVKDVRVLGAVGVVEIDKPINRTRLTAAWVEAGIWARPFGNFAYLMPPFTMSETDAKTLVQGFIHGLEQSGTIA